MSIRQVMPRVLAQAQYELGNYKRVNNMDAKTTRNHLNNHAKAIKDIELTEAAIYILERVSGCSGVVSTLKKKQQEQLRRIDAALAATEPKP